MKRTPRILQMYVAMIRHGMNTEPDLEKQDTRQKVEINCHLTHTQTTVKTQSFVIVLKNIIIPLHFKQELT